MRSPTRSASIILVIIALVSALVLMATLFLAEVHGQTASGKTYLKRSLARFAAEAGLVHAQAVADQQLLDEATSKQATTPASPLYRAFRPHKGGPDAVPGEGDEANTVQIISSVADWPSSVEGSYGTQPVQYQDPAVKWKKNNRYTRFISQQYYDQDLQPTTDVSKAFYQARYDVLPVNIDPLLSVRPDFGPDEYREPADSDVFGLQDSVMLGSLGSALPSGHPEIDYRRSIREQYKHLYARSLASTIACEPETSWDGMRGERIWEKMTVLQKNGADYKDKDGKTYPVADTSGDFWCDGSTVYSGDGVGRLQHLNIMPEHSITLEYNDAWYNAVKNHRYGYDNDAARHMADLFHGAGLTRKRNPNGHTLMNPSAERSVTHQVDGSGITRKTDDYKVRWNPPAVVAMAGEQSYSHRMVWVQYYNYNSGSASGSQQHPPFASGIVDRDPAVDATTMDVGGVPWEINPLTAPTATLRRMIVGLSPQLLAASGGIDHGSVALKQMGLKYAPDGDEDKDWLSAKIWGYNCGGIESPGNRQLELLFDPPRPTASDHSFAGSISARFGDPELTDAAYAGLNPFYNAAVTVDPKKWGPPKGQENPDQLFDYLDGLKAADGSAMGSADPRERFLNRVRYLRWVSWKHEFGSSSPMVEQRLGEVDAFLTYEEGLRYYRRPDRRDLRMDVGTITEREPFDSSAAHRGVHVNPAHPAGTPGVQGANSTTKLKDGSTTELKVLPKSKADGTPRYRIFPHTYPGPMWTGREGRWEEGAADPTWVCPLTGRSGLGAGTSEAVYTKQWSGAAYDLVRTLFTWVIDPPSGEGYRLDGGNHTPIRREWATDAFAWDVAIAAFHAIAEARDKAETEYTGGGVSTSIQDIDQRLVTSLAVSGTAPYVFASNVPVVELYNPIEPIDVDNDGLYEPGGDDRIDLDIDGDGTSEQLPAIRDPEYIYLQYNRYWPVTDPKIPHPALDPSLAPRPIADVRDEIAGRKTSTVVTSWKLGSIPSELETFSGDDFYYHHPRNLLMASMMLNDIRQSLLGAGKPQTLAAFAAEMATQVPALGQLAVAGASGSQVFVAGRNQNPASADPRPFSRTGRLVIKPDRFFRLMVRGQLINLSLNPIYRDLDLNEVLIDAVYCSDPNEDGDPSDGRMLFRGEKATSDRTKGW